MKKKKLVQFVLTEGRPAHPAPPTEFLYVDQKVNTPAHQHVYVEHPAVLSRTDTEALQVQTVLVENFVKRVAQLCAQLFTSSALKLRSCVGRTGDQKNKQTNNGRVM